MTELFRHDLRRRAEKAAKKVGAAIPASAWTTGGPKADTATYEIGNGATWVYSEETDHLSIRHPLLGVTLIETSEDLDTYREDVRKANASFIQERQHTHVS